MRRMRTGALVIRLIPLGPGIVRAYHLCMTALGVALLVTGVVLIVLEAHVPSLGVLGVPGVVSIAAGAVVGVSALGGSIVFGVAVGTHARRDLGHRRRRVTA